MLLKYPEPSENTEKQLLNNQKKLLAILHKKKENNKISYTFYSKFKYLNNAIKDFFKSFFKSIRIPFLNNKKNYTYIAFVCNGGIGNLIRQKVILD